MAQVKGNNPITHFPTTPASVSQPTINVPVVANNPSKTVAAAAPGPRLLNLGQSTVKIDPTSHTSANVIDIINNANIPGVKASLDRYGQLVIDGIGAVTGDATLLQQLGLV